MANGLIRTFEFSCPLPANRIDEIELWCHENIGPRLYYLHNERGGNQWRIRKNGYSYTLETNEDYHLMTWLALTN